MQQQLCGGLLLVPGDDTARLRAVEAHHVLEAAVTASAGGKRRHAALVGVIAVEVDVALASASETLLHTARVGIAEARDLRFSWRMILFQFLIHNTPKDSSSQCRY